MYDTLVWCICHSSTRVEPLLQKVANAADQPDGGEHGHGRPMDQANIDPATARLSSPGPVYCLKILLKNLLDDGLLMRSVLPAQTREHDGKSQLPEFFT